MFYNIAQVPNVSGAYDCTHIPILNPCGEDGERFVNRKGFYSLNVQLVSNAEMFITNSVARWPGSTHDSSIFTNSQLGQKVEAGQYRGCCLLEDGGYARSSYMITLLRNPVSRAEHNNNLAHAQTRGVIERLFSILKARFPRLKYCLCNKLNNIMAIVMARKEKNQVPDDENDESFHDDMGISKETNE